jgi:hypothetical protein
MPASPQAAGPRRRQIDAGQIAADGGDEDRAAAHQRRGHRCREQVELVPVPARLRPVECHQQAVRGRPRDARAEGEHRHRESSAAVHRRRELRIARQLARCRFRPAPVPARPAFLLLLARAAGFGGLGRRSFGGGGPHWIGQGALDASVGKRHVDGVTDRHGRRGGSADVLPPADAAPIGAERDDAEVAADGDRIAADTGRQLNAVGAQAGRPENAAQGGARRPRAGGRRGSVRRGRRRRLASGCLGGGTAAGGDGVDAAVTRRRDHEAVADRDVLQLPGG